MKPRNGLPRDAGDYRSHDPFGYLRLVLDRAIAEALSSVELDPGARILDFGSGPQPYRPLLPADCDYIAADLPDDPRADIAIVDGRVELPDASVDLVLSTQVLEHVLDPQLYLAECHRVLRPGGTLLLSTHGIYYHHPCPTDLWRWTDEGLALVMANANLRVESIAPVLGAVPTALVLMMMSTMGRLPWGLRQAVVIGLTLAIRLTSRLPLDRQVPAHWIYVARARREAEG